MRRNVFGISDTLKILPFLATLIVIGYFTTPGVAAGVGVAVFFIALFQSRGSGYDNRY